MYHLGSYSAFALGNDIPKARGQPQHTLSTKDLNAPSVKNTWNPPKNRKQDVDEEI